MSNTELQYPKPITKWDYFKYWFTEKLYYRKYYCAGCDCLWKVNGAFKNRIYFCSDCGTEFLK